MAQLYIVNNRLFCTRRNEYTGIHWTGDIARPPQPPARPDTFQEKYHERQKFIAAAAVFLAPVALSLPMHLRRRPVAAGAAVIAANASRRRPASAAPTCAEAVDAVKNHKTAFAVQLDQYKNNFDAGGLTFYVRPTDSTHLSFAFTFQPPFPAPCRLRRAARPVLPYRSGSASRGLQERDDMHTALKQTSLAVAFAAGLLTTAAIQAAPADTISEQRPVGAFRAIELSGPYHVIIKAQGKPALTLSGERRQVAEIETVVSGDTLIVRPIRREGFHFTFGGRRDRVTIHITAAMLASLNMNGGGDVELEQLAGDRFSINADGSGELHAAGAVRAGRGQPRQRRRRPAAAQGHQRQAGNVRSRRRQPVRHQRRTDGRHERLR
jgi:hypothetical protein